ncbi:hypothetical protein FSW04_20140 [Baekduia soli]|uniref:Uncharacterized protein n=1 Tax=Baekduia soli TaxID=496014 RepID=A0A5B8UA19_9ACTN|nr:hypothetical protein [Baekduia soli]QEC49658.1 hypothetical protein FSW04_20140 [Baekduia soli]
MRLSHLTHPLLGAGLASPTWRALPPVHAAALFAPLPAPPAGPLAIPVPPLRDVLEHGPDKGAALIAAMHPTSNPEERR